jgi:hypothetical protein
MAAVCVHAIWTASAASISSFGAAASIGDSSQAPKGRHRLVGGCSGKGVQALLKTAQQHTMATAPSAHLRIIIHQD